MVSGLQGLASLTFGSGLQNPVVERSRNHSDYRVSGFKSSRVSGFQGFRVSGFQGYRIRWLTGVETIRITGFQCSRVQRFQDYRISELQCLASLTFGSGLQNPVVERSRNHSDYRVSGFKSSKVSGLQDFRITGFSFADLRYRVTESGG